MDVLIVLAITSAFWKTKSSPYVAEFIESCRAYKYVHMRVIFFNIDLESPKSKNLFGN